MLQLLPKKIGNIALGILRLTFVTICVIYIVTSSTVNKKIGDLFFGYTPILYNVNLANFFFTQAAYTPIKPTAFFAHYQLARTYFIQGQLGAALFEINQELKLYPENKRSYYMLGLIYGYMDEEKKAIDAFGEFIEWKPESWAARNDKAWLEFRIGDIDAALETITPVAHLTDNPWVQNTYGVLLMNKKKYKEAEQAFAYAKITVDKLTEKEWGEVYPGNDPRIYKEGLLATKTSIEGNLKLVKQKLYDEVK